MNDLYNFFYNKYRVKEIENDEEKALCERNIALFIEQLYDLERKRILFLSEKQTFIFRKRCGVLDNGQYQTQCEIATELGISHQSVSQQLQRIIEKFDDSIMKIDYAKINNDNLPQEERLQQPIGVLNLSEGTTRALKEMGIVNLSQLVKLNLQELTKIKGVGLVAVNKIITKVHEYKLYFKEEEIAMLVEKEQDAEAKKEKALQLPIHALGFSVSTYKVLVEMGVTTLGELTELSTYELKAQKGIGKIIFKEINALVNKYGLKFADEKITSNTTCSSNERGLDPNLPIEILNFPLPIYNALKRANINCIQDIIQRDIASLCDVRWLGAKGVKEVVTKVKELGFEFDKSECRENCHQDKIFVSREKKKQFLEKYRNVVIELNVLAEKDQQLSEEIALISNTIKSKGKTKIKK